MTTNTATPVNPPTKPDTTTCCVVGGGPGGMMLALLLARQGVSVTLLEAHKDFDRDFRGDTVHPSILEILDQLGLANRLHELRHSKIFSGPTFGNGQDAFRPIDFRRLRTKFPYVMLVPQVRFLEFLAAEASQYPGFRVIMGAKVESLIEEGGAIRGVRYQRECAMHELRADLVVGADGRFSKVRQLAGFEPIKTSPPMDILWFRLPHLPGDTSDGSLGGGFSRGRMLAIFDRLDYWQIGYVFPKGHYPRIKAEGLDALRASIAEIYPRFTEHVQTLTDWRQFSLLAVESSRCAKWSKPGLLLIGDAAHVMSPIGGVGINYAIQDAVVAANELAEPLREGRLELRHLRKVQRMREWPTRLIQTIQSVMQKRVIATVLASEKPPTVPAILPWLMKVPRLNALPARLMAFGVKKVRVKDVRVNPPAARSVAAAAGTAATFLLGAALAWGQSAPQGPNAAATAQGQAQPAPPTSQKSISDSLGVFVYPTNQQSPDQQRQDETACYIWAKEKTGLDPMSVPANATQQEAEGSKGGGAKGAVGGAAAGTAIGAVSGDVGRGAAIGAIAGGLRGRMAQRKAEKQAEQIAKLEAQAAQKRKIEDFRRAFGACMEPRGYSVK